MQRLATRLSHQKYWDQTAFNEEIFFLSHGDTTVVPISVRIMEYWRFMNSKVRWLLQIRANQLDQSMLLRCLVSQGALPHVLMLVRTQHILRGRPE